MTGRPQVLSPEQGAGSREGLFRGGALFAVRRKRWSGHVCPMLPPAMPARCAMTCSSMRTH